jgi:hypothetical protein
MYRSSLSELPSRPHLEAISVSIAKPSSLIGSYFIENGKVKLLIPYDLIFTL